MGFAPPLQAPGSSPQRTNVSLVQPPRGGYARLRPGPAGPGGVAASPRRADDRGAEISAQQPPGRPAAEAWPAPRGPGRVAPPERSPGPVLSSIPAPLCGSGRQLFGRGLGPGRANQKPERGQNPVHLEGHVLLEPSPQLVQPEPGVA